MVYSGYDQFRTPFYEIVVMDSTGKRKVNLPHHILRLIEKVEVTETFMSSQSHDFGTLNITFIEGSREPASPDASLGTSGLYKIPLDGGSDDKAMSGSLTNRSGIITDLRFSGNNGITFTTGKEKRSGKTDSSVQTSVSGKTTTREHKNDDKSPMFLFQERNRIQITWGYKEGSSKTYIGHIITVQTEFSESGTKTIISAVDPNAFLDQFGPSVAKTFGTRTTTAKGNSIVTFTDNTTDKVLRDIADQCGIAKIVSTNLPAEVVDKDKQKIWLAGTSFNEFMNALAKRHDALWRIIINPKTHKETLVFMTRTDFEKKTIFADKNLLIYKAPRSIIKNVSIKADFGAPFGNAQKGVDSQGNEPAEVSKDTVVRATLFTPSGSTKTEEWVDVDPKVNNPIPIAKNLDSAVLNGKSVGTVDLEPSDTLLNKKELSDRESTEMAKTIVIDFTTLGYTKLTPGVVELGGIGSRYSGKYRLISVTHTIDSNGYTTKCMGTSYAVAVGGKGISDTAKGTETDPKVRKRLFKNSSTVPDVFDDWHELNGSK